MLLLQAPPAGFFYHTLRFTVKQLHSIYPHRRQSNSPVGSPTTSSSSLRQVTEIELRWLTEVAPHYYRSKEIEETTRKMPKTKGISRADLDGRDG